MSAATSLTLGYDAKAALYDVCPEMGRLSHELSPHLETIGTELSKREWKGADTSYARAALLEVRWRINATGDVEEARDAFARLQDAMARPDPPGALVQDAKGSFAPGAEPWFLKLDRSTDQLLARQWPFKLPPVFLEEIDDPLRMIGYLEDLAWCDVARRRCDTRKELNLAISVIARLVMRGGQAGYLSAPGFVPALERFVAGWQNPETGFFGVTYILDPRGSEVTVQDLSLTFHVARYLPHLVSNWPLLVDTLLAAGTRRYPEGWRNADATLSDHNNYDVAEILRRAWRFMKPKQRSQASDLVAEMARWCLGSSVTIDGRVVSPDPGDMVPDSYYFAAAFLDTIGIFDRGGCFWTACDPLPAGWTADGIQTGMAKQLASFHPHLTVVSDALERLHIHRRVHSSAIL